MRTRFSSLALACAVTALAACGSSAQDVLDLGDLGSGKADGSAISVSLEPSEQISFSFFFLGDVRIAVTPTAAPSSDVELTVEQDHTTFSDGAAVAPMR